MPMMQTALTTLNATFSAQNLAGLDPSVFDPGSGATLVDGLVRAGADLDDATQAYVRTWPTALQAALQAAIYENLRREGSVPVTFAWAPGYDFELSMWDVRDTKETAGGITVLLKSRYPSDAHPLGGEAVASS